uniref:CSON001698 protein n=1 Tax=Culicoides sonorensis TaxID=179676 RepID=A0A336LV02_CULSO
MTSNIFQKLAGSHIIQEIIRNWENTSNQNPKTAIQEIVQLIVDMTGFSYEVPIDQIEVNENNPRKYANIIQVMAEKGEFLPSRKFLGPPNETVKVNRFESLIEMLFKTSNLQSIKPWLNVITKMTDELLKNNINMPILVHLATFIRIIVLKSASELRRKFKDQEKDDPDFILRDTCKKFFSTIYLGFKYQGFHENYVSIFLSLFQKHPDFYILNDNCLDQFCLLFTLDRTKTINIGIETLQNLMEGKGINLDDDDDDLDEIRKCVADFFEQAMHEHFFGLILHARVAISKVSLQLLNCVQRYRGQESIFDKEQFNQVIKSVFHDSKTIRVLIMEYMKIVMDPREVLNYFLDNFDKYEINIKDILSSIFDVEVFTFWDVYFTFLQQSHHQKRTVVVIAETLEHVLKLLTVEYETNRKKRPNETETPEAKLEIIEFFSNFPKFLYLFRVITPNEYRYCKILEILYSIKIEDFTNDIAINVLMNLNNELLSGLNTFKTFIAINKLIKILMVLSISFKPVEQSIHNDILEVHAPIFANSDILSTEEGISQFHCATSIFYTIVSDHKIKLISPDDYADLVNNMYEKMMKDDFYQKVPYKGVLLSTWGNILMKHYANIVLQSCDNELEPSEEANLILTLHTVELWIKTVLNKMESEMNDVILHKKIENFEVIQDLELTSVNSAIILHFFATHDLEMEPETFTSVFQTIVKLTEILFVHSKFSKVISNFKFILTHLYDFISNHHEIALIIQHLGEPEHHDRQPILINLITTLHSLDNSQQKETFQSTIIHTLILLTRNASTAQSRLSMFWTSLRDILKTNLKFKTQDIVLFVGNLTMHLFHKFMKTPKTNDVVNRFGIFDVYETIFQDVAKSNVLKMSISNFITQLKEKHGTDLNEEEEQSIRKFQKHLMKKGTRAENDEQDETE